MANPKASTRKKKALSGLPESTLRVMDKMLRTPPQPRETPKDTQQELKLGKRKSRAGKE
jgi:hypothetical protein